LKIERIISKDLADSCRKYLLTDSIVNILPLGDLYLPLFNVSDVYCATKNNRIAGVCSIYHAFHVPSVVLSDATPAIKRALIKKAVSKLSGDFISIAPPDDAELFGEYAAILEKRFEQQMITSEPKTVGKCVFDVVKVGKNECGLLNKFYLQHNSEAWTPIQFELGPYYCVKHLGKIVSAAGVHIVTPKIAQLGNIVTDEHWRHLGFATACTSAVATDLVSKERILSLFVRKDNEQAIHLYEKLGFRKTRDIMFLLMRKKQRY
jgi:ribosomal protein S18 acetylase RimI-like enzyme